MKNLHILKIRAKTILTLLFCFTGILFTSVVFGQTQTQRQQIRAASNTSVLEQLAVRFDSIYTIQKAEAEQWAIDNGVPIVDTLPDGTTIEIQRIENGRPVYIELFNLNAAKTVSTNKIWPGGSAGLNLSGDGMRIGLWDDGLVNENHIELIGRVTKGPGNQSVLREHATKMTGTIIAAGIDTAVKGMAFQANITSLNIAL